jgi:hypothetical protein
VLGEVGVDALLPAVRAVRAQRVPFRGSEDADRLEVRRLEQDGRRRLRDFRLLAAHDRGDRHRLLGVGDHQVALVELAGGPVERGDLLAGARPADDDPPAAQLVVVERVQRAAERVHDVVRHVDDVRDRPHPGRCQPRLQPRGRGRDRDLPEEPADVAGTALCVLDLDPHLFLEDTSGV